MKPNPYNRPNKLAVGVNKTEYRNIARGKGRTSNTKHIAYNGEQSRIVLALAKKVKKEHSTDKGYYREVYILSDYGKTLLKNKK